MSDLRVTGAPGAEETADARGDPSTARPGAPARVVAGRGGQSRRPWGVDAEEVVDALLAGDADEAAELAIAGAEALGLG